jgi:hypothetical protein
MLSQNVDAGCAASIQRRLESRRATCIFVRNARNFKEKGNKIGIVTDTGEELVSDLFVAGMGIKANSG